MQIQQTKPYFTGKDVLVRGSVEKVSGALDAIKEIMPTLKQIAEEEGCKITFKRNVENEGHLLWNRLRVMVRLRSLNPVDFVRLRKKSDLNSFIPEYIVRHVKSMIKDLKVLKGK